MLEKITELCKKKGISVAKLEKELNFGNATINKWRTSSPSAVNLKKVADYFGVSIEYFLEENDSK